MVLSQTLAASGVMFGLAIGTSTTAAKGTDIGKTLKIFISGHSLTDQPFPDYLAEIAANTGVTLSWHMQSLPGSSILQRLNDRREFLVAPRPSEDPESRSLADPDSSSTPGSEANDIMVITEQHRVLDSLIWQDSFKSLRAYHDRFVATSPTGKTYFFAPWISLSDRADPRDWVAYEEKALSVWRCMVSQINIDLATEGRDDRIRFIPTSWALARLVEHMTASADVAGFEGLATSAKMDAIFTDDVHLSRLGMYYVAAITYSAIHSEDVPRLAPPSLEPGQAMAVRDFAVAFMREYRESPPPSDEDCASGVSLAFAVDYAAYTERTYHRQEEGILAARIKRFRDTFRFAWRFRNGLR